MRNPPELVKLLTVATNGKGGGKRKPSPPPTTTRRDTHSPISCILTQPTTIIFLSQVTSEPPGGEGCEENQRWQCPVAQLVRACDCYNTTSQGREFKPLRGSIFLTPPEVGPNDRRKRKRTLWANPVLGSPPCRQKSSSSVHCSNPLT